MPIKFKPFAEVTVGVWLTMMAVCPQLKVCRCNKSDDIDGDNTGDSSYMATDHLGAV